MTTRKADARALLRWAEHRGADVRRGRRGWVVSLRGRHVAVVHETPSRGALRCARADLRRALRDVAE
ncbi:MAG: hypothetical protein M0Z46_06535 [Actinomycetota bacterium]|jgi:hypothetical protein|nr:hypothetical protein [Actinomycetota bacterium]MDA8358955.1 hypothetical protein [Actinomycetota bacterium]